MVVCGIDKLTNGGRSIFYFDLQGGLGSQLRVEYRFVHLCSNLLCPVSTASPPEYHCPSKLDSNQVDFVTGYFRHEYDGKIWIGPLVKLI